MEINLQPLRITSGWNIEWNLFYEVDPSEETMTYFDSSSLLHLNNHAGKIAINLDWRPENNVNGFYNLRVIRLTETKNKKGNIVYEGDWENLLFELQSKNRIEIVNNIERLVVQF